MSSGVAKQRFRAVQVAAAKLYGLSTDAVWGDARTIDPRCVRARRLCLVAFDDLGYVAHEIASIFDMSQEAARKQKQLARQAHWSDRDMAHRARLVAMVQRIETAMAEEATRAT